MGDFVDPLVGDETEKIAGQDDFPALVRALTRAQGFALYFVQCNVPVYRRKVADVVRRRLDRPVVNVDLGEVDRSPTRPSIDYVLDQQLAEAPENAAVFVWSLEHLLPSTEVDQAVTEQTLTEVNWRRSAFTRLERPLVIWLPEYAIRYLARNAPDFFDWNSGLYVFNPPANEQPALLDESLQQMHGDTEMESLLVSDKRQTEAHLKALLDEYVEDTEFDRKARVRLYLRLARLYSSRNSYGQAEECAHQSLELSKTLSDLASMATSIYNLASIALGQGEHERAREEFAEALQIRQQIGDRSGEAATRHQLATIALEQGEYGRAREEFTEALQIRQEIGDRSGEAATRHQLATIALEQGEYERARSEFTEALQNCQEIGDRSGEAATRHQLASIAVEQGEYERAREEFTEALQIRQEIGDRSGEAATRHQLATIALEQGEYGRAREEFAEALQIRQEIGDRSGEASTRHNLATIALEQGEYERARSEFTEALQIQQEIGDQSGEVATRHNLATIALEQGEYERAREEFTEALQIKQEIGDRSGEASTWAQFGILAADELERKREGLRLLIISYWMFAEIGAAQVEQVEPWVERIASELGYDQETFDEEVEAALSAYRDDRGWSLLREAFPDADYPDDVPPAGGETGTNESEDT